MRTLETVIGVLLIVALLYVAFIVGAVIVRILVGLLALLVLGWLIRRLFGGAGTTRGP